MSGTAASFPAGDVLKVRNSGEKYRKCEIVELVSEPVNTGTVSYQQRTARRIGTEAHLGPKAIGPPARRLMHVFA